MKILYPLEVFYPSQAGGTANTVYWLVKKLAAHGIDPLVIATDKGLPREVPVNEWSRSECGEVIYVRTRFLRLPFFQTWLSIRNVLRADIVHLSSIYFPTSLVTAFAAFFARKKLIWSVHGEVDEYTLKHNERQKRFVLWLVKRILGMYPIFHSTCDEETVFIKRVFGDDARIEQITNYFEVPALQTRRESRYLFYIGRLHHKKGIENLIQAAALSKNFRETDFVLKVAGDGEETYKKGLFDLVERLGLQNKIQFIGQVEGDTKHRLLADAYFTIMPSHTENFGLVVIESLAQNTPVIASTNTPWKILDEEKVGYWVDNSPPELAKTIDEILTMEKSQYEVYRRRGREFVIENFDIEKNIDKWTKFYESVG
ncbi:MAG: glycosyltransferase [Pyrinomonadaceae bacterium]